MKLFGIYCGKDVQGRWGIYRLFWVKPWRQWGIFFTPKRFEFGYSHVFFTHRWSCGPFSVCLTDMTK